MLHVIGILFKIVGLILLFFLVCILLVLLTPIRYRFALDKKAEPSVQGQCSVTWFFGIIRVGASYIDKVFEYQVRLFGFQIMGNQPAFLKKKEKKEKKKQEKEERKRKIEEKKESLETASLESEKEKAKEVRSEKKTSAETSGVKQTKTASGQPDKKKKDKKEKVSAGQRENSTEKWKEKLTGWRQLYEEYHGRELLLLAKDNIIRLFRHVLPRKLEGRIRFGFDDPSVTGKITGVAAIFYPAYAQHFSLEPDFQEVCFEADCKGRGRIQLGFFLYIIVRILLDSNVRRIIKMFLSR